MKWVFLLVIILAVLATAVNAEDASAKISLKLDGAEIGDALAQISQKAQVSILGDSTVKGRVTCSLNDVTVEQALDLISKMNKLEWFKVRAAAPTGEKLSAASLFTLMDALKELEGFRVIWEVPAEKTEMIFVPALDPEAVDTSVFADKLELKEVYLLRARPDPEAEKAKKEGEEAEKQAGTIASGVPPADPRVAATQVWDYFANMSAEQRVQVMREMRNMFQSMSPEERETFARTFFGGFAAGEAAHIKVIQPPVVSP